MEFGIDKYGVLYFRIVSQYIRNAMAARFRCSVFAECGLPYRVDVFGLFIDERYPAVYSVLIVGTYVSNVYVERYLM